MCVWGEGVVCVLELCTYVCVCSSVVNFILVLCTNLSLHVMQCKLLAIRAENNYTHTLCLLMNILYNVFSNCLSYYKEAVYK